MKANPTAMPTIKTRNAAIRAHLRVAVGLTHAAREIGDLTIPDSDVQADDLAGHTRELIGLALNELYWVETIGERNAADGAALDAHVPG